MNAHAIPHLEAQMGSQSMGQGAVDTGDPLLNASFPRVANAVIPVRMASSNMGRVVQLRMVLLARDTVKDSIHGWDSQTTGILETVG